MRFWLIAFAVLLAAESLFCEDIDDKGMRQPPRFGKRKEEESQPFLRCYPKEWPLCAKLLLKRLEQMKGDSDLSHLINR